MHCNTYAIALHYAQQTLLALNVMLQKVTFIPCMHLCAQNVGIVIDVTHCTHVPWM
jgi:hypothetical protein